MSVQESKDALSGMATPEFTKNMSAMIRSRSALIYLVTSEEKRVLEYFRAYTTAGGYKAYVWDCYNGLLKLKSMEQAGLISEDSNSVHDVLDHIVKEAGKDEAASNAKREKSEHTQKDEDEFAKDEGVTKGNIYILLDFHRWLEPEPDPDTERRLRTLARISAKSTVILVGPHYVSSPALEKEVRVIDFPYPNKQEIKKALYRVTSKVLAKVPGLQEKINDREEEIINSVMGLTDSEMVAAFGKSVCLHKDLHIPTILKEKQEVIRKTGILEFFNPDVSINDVGGLSNLTDFLKARKAMFSEEAREYGLPSPKGVLLCGVPGTGKSLAAKAAATLFQMPLLRLDFGALFSSHVGDSEKSARTATKIAEQIAPCVLWIDEIEKGLTGIQSSGQTDGGVTSRVIGTLLTWMQEKTAPVFLMCTANNHAAIPPEFMRAGRFDEIFFVDVPTRGERVSIAEKLLTRKKRQPKSFDLEEISAKSEGYTGAEIEKAIDIALLKGFQDGRRPIRTDDIVEAFTQFKPISVMRKVDIELLRTWADGHCIKANSPDVIPGSVMNSTKELDLDD